MDLLMDWVTQIVIFLILAAIIDLLMPNNAMKKYIQFVAGLILILIFLKPVLSVFDININETIEASLRQTLQSTEMTEDMDGLIKIKKSEIESSQDAYILEEMAVQLKKIGEEPLAEKHQATIIDVQFKFNESGKTEFESLEEIIVYLAESEEKEGAVDDVADVVIDTEQTRKKPETDELNDEEIKETLREVWEIDDINLTIIQEGGAA